MINQTQPTDVELEALAEEHLDAVYQFGQLWIEGQAAFARAVLAKWGTPSVETNITIPTNTMEQEFQNHYRRGFEAGKKLTTPQATPWME